MSGASRWRDLALVSCISVTLALAVSCSGGGTGKSKNAPAGPSLTDAPFVDAGSLLSGLPDTPGMTGSYTLDARTVRVARQDVTGNLRPVSADGRTYTFDATRGALGDLRPGRIMFLEGLAMRSVTSVRTVDGALVVETAPCRITDALQDAHLRGHVTLDWSHLVVDADPDTPLQPIATPTPALIGQTAQPARAVITPGVRLTAASSSFKFAFQGFEFEFQAEDAPGGEMITYRVTAAKDPKIGLEGSITLGAKFMDVAMDIAHNGLKGVSISFDELKGATSFHVIGSSESGANLQLPAVRIPFSAEIPSPWTGVPLVLKPEMALLLNLGFGAHQEAEEIGVDASFGGSGGGGVGTDAPSSADAYSGSVQPQPPKAASLAAIGAVAAVNLRMGLALGVVGYNAGVYVEETISIGMTYSGLISGDPGLGGRDCYHVTGRVKINFGLNVELFNLASADFPASEPLVDQSKQNSVPTGCRF